MPTWRYETAPVNHTHMQPYPLWIVFEDEGIPVAAPIVAWSGQWADTLKPAVPYAGEMLILQSWHEVFATEHAADMYLRSL